MADYTNLKQQIAEAIRANGEGAITGPLLQEQLLDIVDAMEVDTWDGFITSDTEPPTDTNKPHVLLAVEEGTYEDFGLTVEDGDIWVVCRMADEVEVVEDPVTGETTEVPIWTKVNLAAGLKAIIQSIEEGKQDALTPGVGVEITEEQVLNVNVGYGLIVNSANGIEVNSTDSIVDYPNLPANGKGVTNYIEAQKGTEIATLGDNGHVPMRQLPDDLVGFDEDGTDPSEEFDELQRLLDALYQAIADVQQTQRDMDATTAECEDATEAAISASQYALNAKDAANAAATSAAEAASHAEAAADSVDAVITDAETAIADAVTATTAANTAAQNATEKAALANTAATSATAAATNANTKAGLANDAATLANTKAELADTKATYADEMGDYAKEQGDAAKEVVDEGIVLEETLQPTDQELIDEYDRVLRQAYQGITDMQEATAATEEATTAAETATTRANNAAAAAEGVISNASAAVSSANTAAEGAQQAATAANNAATTAIEAAQSASTAATQTEAAITAANTATYAATQATAAANSAADSAITAMNAAKGTFPSLNARLNDIDATIIEFVEDDTDTFSF